MKHSFDPFHRLNSKGHGEKGKMQNLAWTKDSNRSEKDKVESYLYQMTINREVFALSIAQFHYPEI